MKQLAQNLDVSQWNLLDWRWQYVPSAPARTTEQMEAELCVLRRENEGLRNRRDILKRDVRHPCRPRRALQANGSPGRPSSRARTASARAPAEVEHTSRLCQAHDASRRTYGIPRLVMVLRRQGQWISRRRVLRLMKAAGIAAASGATRLG